MDKTTLYAYISFTRSDDEDDFPLEVVTERLGIQPTTAWKVGERVNTISPRVHFFTSWKYGTESIETLDSDDVLHPIFNKFKDKTETINQLKNEFNLNVKIAMVISMIDGHSPGLGINPEFSAFAAAINAPIDIDMYVYPFNEMEE